METSERTPPIGDDLDDTTSSEQQALPQSVVEPPGPLRGPRNQKACDGCRSRKVKCFSSPAQDRCQGCVFLDIPCTNDRPRRKRGPPNKTQLRAAVGQLQSTVTPPPATWARGTPLQQPPCHGPTPLSHTDEHVMSPAGLTPSLLDEFAPRALIMRILGGWFNEVHALAPVLFRGHFLRRIAAGEADGENSTFCGLVVSVCAATIATLRRESSGDMTIEACRDFIEKHQLLHKGVVNREYTLDWCIAMYNMATATMALPHDEENEMSTFHAWNQAAAGTRYLAYYSVGKMGKREQEQLKRLFWLLFVASASSDCQGKLVPGFMTHQENLKHLQMEALTDAELDPDPIAPADILTSIMTPEAAVSPCSESSIISSQNWDHVCYVPGLDSLRKLYGVWHDSQTVPAALLGGPDQALQHYQERIQEVIDCLPRELRWRGGLSRPSYVTQGHESQTVNIFISSLHLRSNLMQKRAEHNLVTAAEHQRIIDDLLEILYHLPPPVFHANGLSLMPKVRDIGAAYLEEMGACSERTPDVQDRMERLSCKLGDLDCWADIPQIRGFLPGG